jgi:type II secretory pathway pseudopilin PulG
MSRKAIIILVIVVIVIIIGVVGFLIYKKNKDKKDKEAANQLAMLQAQLNQNPNMPPQAKAGIVDQIAMLMAQIQGSRDEQQTNQYPQGFPGLGGPWTPPINPSSTQAPYGFPLKTGSSGNYVANLQNALNKTCNLKLVPDGKFGPLTANAAKSCFGNSVVSWELYRSQGLA